MKKAEKKPAQTPEKKKEIVTVNVALLNVRAKPTKESEIVRQERKGTKLEKIGSAGKGAWTKIPDGYVMTEFVS